MIQSGRRHEHGIEQKLRHQVAEPAERQWAAARDEAQRERRHDRHANDVTDEKRAGSDEDIARFELRIQQQEQREEKRGKDRTASAGNEQDHHVPQVIETDVESQVLSCDGGNRAVDGRENGGDAENDRPLQLGLQDRGFGDDDAGEQHGAVAWTAQHHQGEDDAQARIPGRDRHALVFMDEADPLEHHVGEEESSCCGRLVGEAQRP